MLRRLLYVQLASILLYVWVAEFVARGSDSVLSPEMYSVFAILGVGLALTAFVVFQRMVSRHFEVLQTQPDHEPSLTRSRAGYIITFAFCEAIALFGVVVRVLGASTRLAVPFFVGAAILLLLFYPRRP
ncbi:MAG: hypothetical protein L0Z53_19545 [Acidobacteriales bacterium]|nr:hypothetical protein [Terriglobales bacterium]